MTIVTTVRELRVHESRVYPDQLH